MVTRPCDTFPRTSLKFRTAGFPQYGFKPAVGGHLRPRADAQGLIGAPKSIRRPLTVALLGGQSPHCVGVEANFVRTLRPRGPWLGVGLFCPVASTLTMASSELLTPAPDGLWSSPAGLCRSRRRGRGPEGPCFQLRILPCVPPSVPRQTGRPEDDSTSARDSLRPSARGSASAMFPLESVHVGCPFEAV